ncbi:MAG: enoyl-CoA hydratase/isomerase family protein [candidate division WOR-3 bacterium]
MRYETIICEQEGAVLIIRLNRPHKRNALNETLHRELISILNEFESEEKLKVVIITGDKEAFSTGADLSEVAQSEEGMPKGPNAIERLYQVEKPTIAAIDGWCVAGGLELALACDMRIAAETAKIGDRHIKVGFIGGAGAPTRLVRTVGLAKAMELILTGKVIDGKEAFQIGLVNKVVPREDLLKTAKEFADQIAEHSTLALILSKKALRFASENQQYESMAYTETLLRQLLSSAEYKEKIARFAKK